MANEDQDLLIGDRESMDVEVPDYSPSSATIMAMSIKTEPVDDAAAQSLSGTFQSTPVGKRKATEILQSPDIILKKPRDGDPGSHLANILEKATDGIIITRSFITNNGFLKQPARKFLVHLIVNYELKRSLGNLSLYGTEQLREFTLTFMDYANEIAAMFPSEDPRLYYNPFQVVKGVRKEATGKLWEHYNYMKSVLREQGVLAKPSRKEPVFETVMLNDPLTDNLKWLETNVEPPETVLDVWMSTFDARRELLLKHNLTLYDYYSKFLCLRTQNGIYLIQSDFEKLYPDAASALTWKWDLIKDHLISKLKSSKAIKDVAEKALVMLLPTLPKDQQIAVVFHLLTATVPHGRIGVKKKTNTDESKNNNSRMTLQEQRDSFTLIVPTAAQLDAELKKVRVDLNRIGQTLPPTPVIVGGIVDIESCYVAVNDTLYKTNSYMEAVDLAFKIFFVTNSAYPERSRSLWQLIERGIFAIVDQPGKCYSVIEFLAGELRAIVKQNSD